MWSISKTIWDYRIDDGIPRPTADHVDRWVKQFPKDKQLPILFELDHVLRTTYFSKARVHRSLSYLALSEHFAGPWPAEFWTRTALLDIQITGESQRRLNSVLRAILSDRLGVSPARPEDAQSFVYLDDSIYTGKTAIDDIRLWLGPSRSLHNITLNVITLAYYQHSKDDLAALLPAFASNIGKRATVHFWTNSTLYGHVQALNTTDLIQPKKGSSDTVASELPEGMLAKAKLRESSAESPNRLFSSEAGRDALEQGLLWAGAHLYPRFRNLQNTISPLGFGGYNSLGFGNLFLTYLNCPNTCPTALWSRHSWYPLFPRRNNE